MNGPTLSQLLAVPSGLRKAKLTLNKAPLHPPTNWRRGALNGCATQRWLRRLLRPGGAPSPSPLRAPVRVHVRVKARWMQIQRRSGFLPAPTNAIMSFLRARLLGLQGSQILRCLSGSSGVATTDGRQYVGGDGLAYFRCTPGKPASLEVCHSAEVWVIVTDAHALHSMIQNMHQGKKSNMAGPTPHFTCCRVSPLQGGPQEWQTPDLPNTQASILQQIVDSTFHKSHKHRAGETLGSEDCGTL